MGEHRALGFHGSRHTGLVVFPLPERDHRLAVFDRLIALSDEEAALSPEIRQQRESELLSDLLAQEMIEAACVWKSIEAQAPIEFRADLDPKAVLQVRLVTLAQPMPATSPGLAYDVIRAGR